MRLTTRRRAVLCAALLFALTWAAYTGAAPLTCRAPGSPAPCSARSTPGPQAEPQPGLGVGNPIALPSGEKFLRDIDVPLPAHQGHPSFVRLYRATRASDGPLGTGWRHEYDIHLQRRYDGWRMDLPDGRILYFDGAGRGPSPEDGMVHTHPATGQAQWEDGHGRTLQFNEHGQLMAAQSPEQGTVALEYHPPGQPFAGLLHTVRNPRGALVLHYAPAPEGHNEPAVRLTRLATPLGDFHYAYVAQPARLHTVQRPDGMQRRYHYEPEWQSGHAQAITGVSLQDAAHASWRARSWHYDEHGRVIRAVAGPWDAVSQHATQPPAPVPAWQLRYESSSATGPVTVHLQSGLAQARFTYSRPDAAGRLLATHTQACSTCPAWQSRFHYDAQGRLQRVGSLQLHRDAHGRLQGLSDPDGGWPGLRMSHDARGWRRSWFSTLTGQTQSHYSQAGRLREIEWANGRRLALVQDSQGRPTRLRHTRPQTAPMDVQIQWRGMHPRRIIQAQETETLRHDDSGRLIQHHVHRPRVFGALSYQESMDYDRQGRLLRHHLPEGGQLHYSWSHDGALQSLHWLDAQGQRHTVLDTVPGLAGYRYGNGLHLQGQSDARGQATALVLSQGTQLLWGERRQMDGHGRTVRQAQWLSPRLRDPHITTPHHTAGMLDPVYDRQLAYDDHDRQVALQDGTHQHGWVWASDGSLARRTVDGQDQALPVITRDPSGLPLAIGTRQLHYNAQGRLARVQENGRTLVRHLYNARGHQIRSVAGDTVFERYYLDNRLVGVWQHSASERALPPFGITQRYLYANEVPVGLLQREADGQTRLYFIHADLLGMPVLITDGQGRLRWHARADSLGRVITDHGDVQIPLRRPGQAQDPVTGWHDNVFRTYLPDRGQYLEPDPLGPLPGQQALGYAGQQFLRHTDPLGLILLAFDGTRHGPDNQSNVWKLAQAYADGAAYYHSGPGNPYYLDWDAVTAASSQQILKNQWQSLLNSLERARGSAQPLSIDILGFSRGAALAREFANRIARNTENGWFSYDDPMRGSLGVCVDLRFLGLFDTVAQFGLLGAANAGYDLTISSAWQWVAHAVATHEYRSLFPLVSVRDSAAAHTIEAPFIGAHGDIGGGLLGPDTDWAGDLPAVALNWMRWQALAALVPMQPLAPEDQRVGQPLLHDERPSLLRGVAPGDRLIQDSATRPIHLQGRDPDLGRAQRDIFEAFLDRSPITDQPEHVVGRVDMPAYQEWPETRWGMPDSPASSRTP